MKLRFTFRALFPYHVAIVLSLSVCADPSGAQTVSHEVVTYSGDAVPGLSGVQFTTLDFATMSPDGRLTT